jgi:hypothetical protein
LVTLFNIFYGMTGLTIAKKTYPDTVILTSLSQTNKEGQNIRLNN